MNRFLFVGLIAFFPVASLAQQAPQPPQPLPVTVTLDGQEFQAVMAGLSEVKAGIAYNALNVLIKAEQDAQAKAAEAKKAPAAASAEPAATKPDASHH